MPNPCVPYQFPHNFGPFRIGLQLTLPTGYTDRTTSGGDGIAPTSEVHNVLWDAFATKPPECTEPVPGFDLTEVWIGADDVANGWPVEPADPTAPEEPADPLHWYLQTWIYAPYAPSNRLLDYPWLAGRWTAGLTRLELPEGLGTIGVTVTTVVYRAEPYLRFTGVLPPGYPDSAPPEPRLDRGPGPGPRDVAASSTTDRARG